MTIDVELDRGKMSDVFLFFFFSQTFRITWHRISALFLFLITFLITFRIIFRNEASFTAVFTDFVNHHNYVKVMRKVGSLFMVCFRAENSRVYERRSITSTIIEHYCPVPLQCANGLEHM